ncbi:hypothetical protein MTR67_046464 [Solanum verrucosum]|uniref:Uncharacterized protein n=1 Tax=Solanum verrucosum TaxID=315347 RepID=A0AAF0UWJ8_SOLVR|nr:hypothetical protein MTR67_046464 [Solanum verrucosum]
MLLSSSRDSWRSSSEKYNHDGKDEGALVNDVEVRMIIPLAPVITAKEERELVSAPPFYPYKHERLDNGFVYLIKQLDGQNGKDGAIKLKHCQGKGFCETDAMKYCGSELKLLVLKELLIRSATP